MKVMCKMSIHPIRIHNNVIKWVYCPTLIKRKIQKINIDKCEECHFFIGIKNTELMSTIKHMKTRSSIIIRPGFKRREYKNNEEKTIYIKEELNDDFVPLVDVFNENDKVRILTEIPLRYIEKEIELKYENEELVIQIKDYKQHIPINNDLTIDLIGDVKLCSLKNGIMNVELKKEKKELIN